jgi:hypothetical protein
MSARSTCNVRSCPAWTRLRCVRFRDLHCGDLHCLLRPS